MWPKISHLTTRVFRERKLLIVVEFYYFIPIRIRGQHYCTPSLRLSDNDTDLACYNSDVRRLIVISFGVNVAERTSC